MSRVLIGRQDDLDAVLKWVESKPNTPSARLLTGEGGAGKTRLAATVAQVLRDRGWTAGFIDPESDPFEVATSPKGVFLIIDYPEEKSDQTKAALKGLAERTTMPFPLRVLFLSRRSFAEWEQEALLLEGRFGNQAISAASPLSIDDGLRLIEKPHGTLPRRSNCRRRNIGTRSAGSNHQGRIGFLFLRRRLRYMQCCRQERLSGSVTLIF